MREGKPFGTILLRRRRCGPSATGRSRSCETFGDQAAIALENVRLFNETKEALEQQTATSAEVLKTISRTTFELEPVLETLIENATRLLQGRQAGRHQPAGRRELDKVRSANHGAGPRSSSSHRRIRSFPAYGSVGARSA